MNASPPPHPTDQILYAYGLGTLGDPAASAVDSHLEACKACRQRVSELSGDSFLGRLRGAGARPDTPAPGPPRAGVPRASSGPSAPPVPDPALAATLPPELADNPQYHVLGELGRGGMGVVYLARNTLMDRLEVLKILNKETLERKGTYDRFLREIRAAARLSHPNVVAAYSAVQIGHLLVFAMEYVEGADLSKLVKSRGPLPVAHACSFVHQAALGLQHAHERGMVHRDIKPGNLMLSRQGDRGIVKVLDFGLAKATSENPMDGGLTREGQMLGTPDYIAPEQTLDAHQADIRADIYSLGCTLYYLLAGGPPFQGKSLFDILQSHHSVDARPLNLVRPEVPVELAAIVRKMMAKEPPRRYQIPEEVALALRPFCKVGRSGSGSSDGEHSRPGSPEAVQAPAAVISPPSEPALAAAVPVTAKGRAVPSSDQSLRWESLIAIPEPASLTEAKAKSVLSRPGRPRPPWARSALAAAGVLLLGLIGTWLAGISTPVTQPGLLVPKGLPDPQKNVPGGKDFIANGGNHEPPALPIPLPLPVPTPDPEIDIKELPTTTPPAQPTSPPPVANAIPAPPRVEEKKPDAAPAWTVDGFRILFNGRDLQGWKPHPVGKGRWTVEDGILVGRGLDQSHLFTERGEYTHFHARIEARINSGGNSGFCFRTKFFGTGRLQGNGYEASIDSTNSGWGTGSLMHFGPSGQIKETQVKPDEWCTLEVLAVGYRIIIKVNGITTVNFVDLNGTYPRGHLALQQLGASTEARFRKIEVKELSLWSNLKEIAGVGPPRHTGVEEFMGKSYFGFPQQLTWKEAKDRCSAMGGHLAVVTEQRQNVFITQLIMRRGIATAWLGATDEVVEGRWVWVDGSPLGYRNWDPIGKQPNNGGVKGPENYMVLLVRDGGKWCDQPELSLTERPGFVCQWD